MASLLSKDDQGVARRRVPNRIRGGVWPSRREKSRGSDPSKGRGRGAPSRGGDRGSPSVNPEKTQWGGISPQGREGFSPSKIQDFPSMELGVSVAIIEVSTDSSGQIEAH